MLAITDRKALAAGLADLPEDEAIYRRDGLGDDPGA
jgi:hypothetical protein